MGPRSTDTLRGAYRSNRETPYGLSSAYGISLGVLIGLTMWAGVALVVLAVTQ